MNLFFLEVIKKTVLLMGQGQVLKTILGGHGNTKIPSGMLVYVPDDKFKAIWW